MGIAASQHVSKECRTPGTVYGTIVGEKYVELRIHLPHRILDVLPPEDELPRAEWPRTATDRERELVDRFHAAVLPVVEEIFREEWWKLAGREIDGAVMPEKWEDL